MRDHDSNVLRRAADSGADVSRSPGRRTLTMGLPAGRPGAGSEPGAAVQGAEPANAGAAAERASFTSQMLDAAVRPDLHEMPCVQAKLSLGGAGDAYEQEADRVAAQVVQSIGSPGAGAGPRERATPAVMAKSSGGGGGDSDGGGLSAHVERGIQGARGGGAAMATEVRDQMERAFGYDFSAVRIHTDGNADAQARAIGARAFAVGSDLFFRASEYQPHSATGLELLAHELTHVVQQAGGAGATVQRALGMEFECSNFAVACTREAAKGDVIARGDMWKMVYELTAAGESVCEFVIEPAANTRKELKKGVKGARDFAKRLTKKKTTTIGDFTVKADGPAMAAIQVTVGAPLDRMPEIMDSFDSDKEKRALGTYQKMEREKVVAPDGTEFQDLPKETRGFILLLMDYLRRGWVPKEYRPKHPPKDSGEQFVKAIFEMMARNDFTSIFSTLSGGEKDRISRQSMSRGVRVMKQAWVKFIVEHALEPDHRGLETLLGEQMVNHKIKGWDESGAGPERGAWLTDLPHQDLLTDRGYMGIGKMGDRMDRRKSDGKGAPLIEMRSPYQSSKDVSQWKKLALEAWDTYVHAVGGDDVERGG
jgi:Domain of unknown function (DUF4157)